MNRQDRDRYDRGNYANDYNGYDGYSREDEHYHSGRNLTNSFEQDFQRERGYSNQHQPTPTRSYHEGDGGDAYERLSRERGYGNQPDNRYRNNNYTYTDNRSSARDYQDNARSDRGLYNRQDEQRGTIRQGYGNSGFGGPSDRYSDQNREGEYNSRRSENSFKNTGAGSNRSQAFEGPQRNEPRTSHGTGSYSDDYSNFYGSRNYGSGSGYGGANRSTSYDRSYGSSSDNYGALGGNRSGNARISRNPNRDINESGNF